MSTDAYVQEQIDQSNRRLMELALSVARQSPDPSTQNGALLATPSGRALHRTIECNRFPDGISNTPERWKRPAKYSWVEHAERNAIYAAARHGILTRGALMVCPWAACEDCARAIVQAGIATLITLERNDTNTNERWRASCDMGDAILAEAGVEVTFITGSWGVTLRRDEQDRQF